MAEARRARTKVKTKWGDREGRRRDILEAARTLLEREGYGRLGIREVARGARVSAGTVYTYFASREELFAVLYSERLEQFQGEIEPLCSKVKSAEDLFVEIARRYLPMYRVFGRELNLWSVFSEQRELPVVIGASLRAAALGVLATVQAALARLRTESGLSVLDSGEVSLARGPARFDQRLALPFLWVTLNGLCDHFSGQRKLLHSASWDELSRFTARTVVAGLLAPTMRTNPRTARTRGKEEN
jgi:AcrR family transcriptional regulator